MLFTPPVPSFRFRLLTPTPLPRSPLRARTIANATSCCTSGCGNTTAHRASATLFASTRCIATVSLFSLLQKPRYQTDLRSPICPQIAARLASRASSNSAPRASCLTTKASPSCNPPPAFPLPVHLYSPFVLLSTHLAASSASFRFLVVFFFQAEPMPGRTGISPVPCDSLQCLFQYCPPCIDCVCVKDFPLPCCTASEPVALASVVIGVERAASRFKRLRAP
jgi:hypothetical protein